MALTVGTPPSDAPDHKARGHAKISPSKLNYLDPKVGGCFGYLPEEGKTSAAAEAGTEHHEMMDRLLEEWVKWGKKGSFLSHVEVRRIALKWDDQADYLYRFCARAADQYLTKPGATITRELRVYVRDENEQVVTFGHYDVLVCFADVGILLDWKFGVVPVEPAETNRQGYAYSLATFQEQPSLNKIGVIFVQPRLNWVSRHVFHRAGLAELQKTVVGIIAMATEVRKAMDAGPVSEEFVQNLLNPGHACEYCTLPGKCPAYLRSVSAVAPKLGGLPLPSGMITVESIDTPEKAALAQAWAKFLEDGIGAIKKRCLEIADANGGKIELHHPDGTVKFKVVEQGFDRVLGESALVVDALKQWVTPEQVLAAASLSLGALEGIVVPAMLEQNEELTKKAASECMISLLESEGLLSRPDGKKRFLKAVKDKKSQAE